MKKRLFALSLVLAMGVFAGCGNSGSTSGTTASTTDTAASVTDTASEGETPEVAGVSVTGESTAEPAATGTITVTDAHGEVEVPLQPEVVVSLDNRTFETLSDWGVKLAAAPKAVMPADSPYMADENIQDIGNHREPNLEVIAAVNPEQDKNFNPRTPARGATANRHNYPPVCLELLHKYLSL